MKQLFASFTSSLRVLIQPAAYFRATSREALLFNALLTLAAVSIIAAVLIFLAALLNADAIRAAGQAVLAQQAAIGRSFPFALESSAPYARLAFPLYWFAVILYFALIRRGIVALLAPEGLTFARCLALSAHAALPMILVAAGIGLYNQLFPILPESGASLARVLIAIALVFGGWLLEARIWTAGAREVFALSRAQGIFSWLAPLMATIILWVTFFTLLLLLASGTPI